MSTTTTPPFARLRVQSVHPDGRFVTAAMVTPARRAPSSARSA
ncbi:hypothetical protein [Streptomyces sp. NPDC001250]